MWAAVRGRPATLRWLDPPLVLGHDTNPHDAPGGQAGTLPAAAVKNNTT